MLNDVTKAIAKQLKTLYPNYKIYVDKIKQGIMEPCFYIHVVETDITRKLGRRREKNISFDVMFFVEQNKIGQVEDVNFQVLGIGDSLLYSFEKISINNKDFRTTNRKIEVIDDILHFTFDIKIALFEQKPSVSNVLKVFINPITWTTTNNTWSEATNSWMD